MFGTQFPENIEKNSHSVFTQNLSSILHNLMVDMGINGTNVEHKVRVGQIPRLGAAKTLGSPRALYHMRPKSHSSFNARLQSCLAAQSSIELKNILKQSQHPFATRLFYSLQEND